MLLNIRAGNAFNAAINRHQGKLNSTTEKLLFLKTIKSLKLFPLSVRYLR